MLNELYTFAETCSGGPFFKSKMGEIYFTTYKEVRPMHITTVITAKSIVFLLSR